MERDWGLGERVRGFGVLGIFFPIKWFLSSFSFFWVEFFFSSSNYSKPSSILVSLYFSLPHFLIHKVNNCLQSPQIKRIGIKIYQNPPKKVITTTNNNTPYLTPKIINTRRIITITIRTHSHNSLSSPPLSSPPSSLLKY